MHPVTVLLPLAKHFDHSNGQAVYDSLTLSIQEGPSYISALHACQGEMLTACMLTTPLPPLTTDLSMQHLPGQASAMINACVSCHSSATCCRNVAHHQHTAPQSPCNKVNQPSQHVLQHAWPPASHAIALPAPPLVLEPAGQTDRSISCCAPRPLVAHICWNTLQSVRVPMFPEGKTQLS